jgi:hypothetical protein
MAGREHQAQQVVADVIVDLGDELLLDGSAGLERRSDLFVLALGEAPAAQHVDRPVFAVAMSQAPGFSGTPVSGQRSSAATSASWARSSARPTSRTMRASPAIKRGDSIRQTASIAPCASFGDTAAD